MCTNVLRNMNERMMPAARLLAMVVALTLSLAGFGGAAATPNVSLLDLIETEFGYNVVADQYQHPVATQQLLDGARVGLVAYSRSRGIADPQVAIMHARPDGRGAVPA